LQKHVLSNGLTVYLVPSKNVPVVALQAWIRVGSALESEAEAGISHMVEHMLFKGTRRRGVGEIALEIEAAGGDINAWTEFNNTAFHVVIASRYFETGLSVLADALQHPSFDGEELERERQVVLEEMQQGEDSPHRVNFHQLFDLAFQRHPYGRPVIGRREAVLALTRRDLLDFHRRYYAPSNMRFVVVGDIDPDRALRQIRRAFRSKRRQVPRCPSFREPLQRRPRLAIRDAAVLEAYLLLGFHVPGIRHEDAPALDLAATLLGQGESSRLHRRVLRELQLVTDVSAYAYTPHDEGLMTVGATVYPDRLAEAVDALLEETYRLGFDEVADEEIHKAFVLLESNTVLQRETVQGQARKLGYYAYAMGDPGYEEQYLRLLGEVTPAGLRRVMERYLVPNNLCLSAVIPEGGHAQPRGLRRALAPVVRESHRRLRQQRRRTFRPGRGGVVRATLDSGLTLLVKQESSVPLVAVRGVWCGGLRYETRRTNGINNLLASLLTRGTDTRTGEEIVGTIESLAGSIGGFTGRNSLGLRLEISSRHWKTCLEVAADCLQRPSFPTEEIERERALALQEIATRDDNLTGAVFRLFQQRLFSRHPYRLSLLGETGSVGRLSREQLVRYWRKHYRVDGMTLSIVGDMDPSRVVREVERLFPAGRPASRPPRVAVEPPRKGPARVVRFLDKQQAHVLVGFPGMTVRHGDRYCLEVLAAVLSGQGGRLFLSIRDRQGLVYRISAFSLEGLDPGYFAVYGATSPDKVEQVVDSIRAELKRLRTTPVPAAELARAKRYLVGNHDISLQQRATVVSSLAFNDLYGLGYEEYLRYPQAIRAVTAQDLQRVSRRILAPRKEVVAIVAPKAHPDGQ
jgi:zinc protease